ncbi:MAG TPA: hypothetical protein VES95_02875 [Dermatophilaceae bacterium]|nr:hypothetical protein [Dermatophilaceae bacterium]
MTARAAPAPVRPPRAPGSTTGRVLQTLVLAVGAWLVVTSALAALLSAVGLWRPLLVLPLLALAAGGCVLAVRETPSMAVPRWTAVALVAVTAASGAWTAATHSEQVLPRRDAGSYYQQAVSLADTGRRVVPVDPDVLGGPDVLAQEGLTLASPAFYQVGSASDPAIQPQFVTGPAAVYSLGQWLGGLVPTLVIPGLAMAVAALGVGLLTGRVLGVRWAPLAALGTALLFPVLHTARATYSEPLASVPLVAGLLALTAAARWGLPGALASRSALLAGALLGGTALLRVDGLREAVLLIPVAGLVAAQGRRWPRSLLLGAGASTAVAAVAALTLSRRYLGDIAGSLVPLIALGVALAALTWAASVGWERGRRLPPSVSRRLPGALAAAVLAVGLLLASRPLWLTVRQSAEDPGARVVAGLQQQQGLAVDGGRTYAEDTVAWLAWWVGPVALAVALVALAVAVHRASTRWTLGELLPAWVPALVVAGGSTLLTLWRPGITPDHPWAERRLLIPLVLVVVAVLAAAAEVQRRSVDWVGHRYAVAPGEVLHRRVRAVVRAVPATVVVLALLVPTAVATAPHRTERVELGSAAAVGDLCRSLEDGDVVLMVDSRAVNEWPQVVRGSCGHPAVATTAALRSDQVGFAAAVRTLEEGVRASGGRLVLLATDSTRILGALGASDLRQVVDTVVLEDPRLLEERPEDLVPLRITVWLASPGVSGG